jgi:hypothetical protein
MTNNPTKYEQILSYRSWQTILPNMNKFCHTVSEELPSQIIMEGEMDVRLLLCHSITQHWGTKNIISILVARTHIQYIYIARKYIIYLYKFRNRKKVSLWQAFLICFAAKVNTFYFTDNAYIAFILQCQRVKNNCQILL